VQCKDGITFPMSLDLTAFVHPVDELADHRGISPTACQELLEYVLTGILLHRGTSASAGHYVSIMKDEQTGSWWKYDDNCVTGMGAHPFKGARWDAGSGEDPEAKAASGRKAGGGGARKGSAGAKKGGGDARNGTNDTSQAKAVARVASGRRLPGRPTNERAIPLTAIDVRKRSRPGRESGDGAVAVADARTAAAGVKAAQTSAAGVKAARTAATLVAGAGREGSAVIDFGESPLALRQESGAAPGAPQATSAGVHVVQNCPSCICACEVVLVCVLMLCVKLCYRQAAARWESIACVQDPGPS
jgi:hypothetical protein